MTSPLQPTSVMNGIDSLNGFIENYRRSAVVKPRSWDDALLFRKYQLPGSLDLAARKKAAVAKFAKNCQRLKMDLVHFENVVEFDLQTNDSDQAIMLKRAREICHAAFRPYSRGSMHNSVNRALDFPKGAGYATRRADTRNAKYHKGVTLTDHALKYAVRNLKCDIFAPNSVGQGGTRKMTFVRGNRFITVPKNTETERLICIEPEVNLYYQKGIGSWLKTVVKDSFGIDLSCQNRNRTQCANFAFSTIDLSSASDSVTNALVEFLLPRRVFTMLRAFRSPSSQMYDVTIKNTNSYSTFSTMGNGYTFELESLIFTCLARAASEFHGCDPNEVTVFGDDIIIRNEAASSAVELLLLCGFRTNLDKSFLGNAPMRESCGFFFEKYGDHALMVSPLALKGKFQRSIYVKTNGRGESVAAIPLDPELIRVHNEMVRYIDTTNMAYRNDKLYRFYGAVIKKIRSLFPGNMQGRGYFGENQYLLVDSLCMPLEEIQTVVRRTACYKWTNRLLGKGLYGPPQRSHDESLDPKKIKSPSLHRSRMSFGMKDRWCGEVSTARYLGFHPMGDFLDKEW